MLLVENLIIFFGIYRDRMEDKFWEELVTGIMEPPADNEPDEVLDSGNIQNKKRKKTDHFCMECDNVFTTAQKLDLHIAKKHSQQYHYFCDKCESRYTTSKALTLHRLRKHTPLRYFCSICDRGYSLNCDLQQHMTRGHSIERPKNKKNSQIN